METQLFGNESVQQDSISLNLDFQLRIKQLSLYLVLQLRFLGSETFLEVPQRSQPRNSTGKMPMKYSTAFSNSRRAGNGAGHIVCRVFPFACTCKLCSILREGTNGIADGSGDVADNMPLSGHVAISCQSWPSRPMRSLTSP
jgi:hypothetical protein